MDTDVFVQAFQFSRTRIVFPDEGLRVDHFFDGRFHLGAQVIDARSAALRDDHVAVPVEHEPGNPSDSP